MPWGYPQQAELALIAGVFRAQTPQASVEAVVDTVMRSRSHALLDDLEQVAQLGTEGVVEMLGPRWGDTNVLGVPVLRAAVIHGAAQALVDVDVRSADELRALTIDRPDAVERAVLGVRGLGPGTWEWIGLFAHARVRPDSEMIAFLSGEVGAEKRLPAAEAAELLKETARVAATDERTLAYAIRAYLDSRES